MEVVYLIGSLVSSTLTSAVLSLRLVLRCLASCLCRPPGGDFEAAKGDDAPLLRLYQGHVKHVRRSPHHHAFEYPVRYALVNLERPCSSTASPLPSSLFPPSFFAGHLSADNARAVTDTNGPVLLLTIPPSVGYEQNPLSIYYCYDVVSRADSKHEAGAGDDGESMASTRPCLRKCIAEVTNTPWGERASFVFDPRSDLVAKPLHVSPFMDMLGNWKIHAGEPGDKLFVGISVQHPEMGSYFTATLSAKEVSSSRPSPALFFWLMPQKVALWIYWQAVKLWWKNVSFIQHPRYSNPAYREDALSRDRELRCPLTKGGGGPRDDDRRSDSAAAEGGGGMARWCVWRDAEWPWS
ncbi:unnamed protein product [Spirodela intermedia]|uniref:DUF1365 domain-containing protein n=1 Tax=Spirodela intermedia TaxID=51605 RepID=A0A811G8K0_SPIIN|nr:unnamed protein product [Spirodela intermedia]